MIQKSRQKSPEGLAKYKHTVAGINSHMTVTSKVCAPGVSTKTSELGQLFLDQKMSDNKVFFFNYKDTSFSVIF